MNGSVLIASPCCRKGRLSSKFTKTSSHDVTWERCTELLGQSNAVGGTRKGQCWVTHHTALCAVTEEPSCMISQSY